MGYEMLQHVVVTIVALGAAGVVIRRVTGVVRPPTGDSKCSSCPSAKEQPAAQREFPLSLVRAPRD